MKNYLVCIYLFSAFSCYTMVKAQSHFTVEGNIKIITMDTLQANGHLVIRQGDGTLALTPSSAAEAVESPNFLLLSSGFEHYGQGYQIGMYYKHRNRVYLDGLIRKSSGNISLNDTLFVLPPEYSPAIDKDAYGIQRQELVHLKIHSNGVVRVSSVPAASDDWVSIDGLNFYLP